MTKKRKGYRLEKGFLLDYGWLSAMEHLTAEQFRTLMVSLVAYQRSNGRVPLPDFTQEPLMHCIAELILPQLNNRLRGALRQEEAEKADVRADSAPVGDTAAQIPHDAPAPREDNASAVRAVEKRDLPACTEQAACAPESAPPPPGEQITQSIKNPTPFVGITQKMPKNRRRLLEGDEIVRRDFEAYWGSIGTQPRAAPVYRRR